MTAAVFVTYRPYEGRDAAARIGARLAARFSPDRVVFGSELRQTRFAAFRAVVALLGRSRDAHGAWLSSLSAAVQGGVPVVLVLLDGAVRPSAELWPDGSKTPAKAPVLEMSTVDFDRDVERLIAILSPLFDAGLAAPAPAPARDVEARPLSIEELAEAARDSSRIRATSAGDLPVDAQAFRPNGDLEVSGVLGAPQPRPEALPPAPTPEPPPPAAAQPPASASHKGVEPPPPAGHFAPARMPEAAPWPAPSRPRPTDFAPPPSFEAPRRGGAFLPAALGVAVAVAGVALAYHFRNEIAAIIGPIIGRIAGSLFHGATPPLPAAETITEVVDAIAFAPPRAARGDAFMVQIFLGRTE